MATVTEKKVKQDSKKEKLANESATKEGSSPEGEKETIKSFEELVGLFTPPSLFPPPFLTSRPILGLPLPGRDRAYL